MEASEVLEISTKRLILFVECILSSNEITWWEILRPREHVFIHAVNGKEENYVE